MKRGCRGAFTLSPANYQSNDRRLTSRGHLRHPRPRAGNPLGQQLSNLCDLKALRLLCCSLVVFVAAKFTNDGRAVHQDGKNDVPASLPLNTNTQYMADLTSYEDAYGTDPDLQAFGHTLHRANRVINSLALGVEVGSPSFESFIEVTGCLREMNQEVVKVILECKNDIRNNQELIDLVEEYFENSLQALDFLNALEKCVNRARHSQFIISYAIQQFEGEDIEGNRYATMLEKQQKFRSDGDSFTEEFFMIFQSVYKQRLAMLEKLEVRRKKLDKKLECTKTWMRVSNVIFVATFVSPLIFLVVAPAVEEPPVITVLAGALAVAIGTVGKWCNSLWKNYWSSLKWPRELISSMEVGTYKTIEDTDSIKDLVSELEVKIESLMQDADFACSEDEAVKFLIGEIKNKLEILKEKFDKLSVEVEGCREEIRIARKLVLETVK